MIRHLAMSSLFISMNFMLTLHPMENATIHWILYFGTLVLFAITFGVAYSKEQKLEDRVKTLEGELDKLSDNVYSVIKKQSDKIIEYYTEEYYED